MGLILVGGGLLVLWKLKAAMGWQTGELWDGNHQEPVDPGWHETNNLWGGVSDQHASTPDLHANTPYMRPGSVPSGDVPSGQVSANDMWAGTPDLFKQQE